MVLYTKTNIHFWSYIAEFFLEWEMFQIKFVNKITLNSIILFRKSCRLWDNVEKCGRAGQATDGNKIRRMRTAFWIPKAKIIHSECVILTAFPSQQRLGERASMLRYTYIACLVLIANGQEDICNWYNVCILCTVRDIKLLIYITTFTCTEIHTHQTLVYLLHVVTCHRCQHQVVFSRANVVPSKWSVAR